MIGFNPLHCGAVVASSCVPLRLVFCIGVSIPFIAGQWSLQPRWYCWCCVSFCFNPLHCGAVVASCPSTPPANARYIVSFQSPSLRGSGRFLSLAWKVRVSPSSFNPLHCGAVVASDTARRNTPVSIDGFNPLHCGAVVASPGRPPRRRPRRGVSIPFIAGQWSLHLTVIVWTGFTPEFQSPSLRGSGRFRRRKEETWTSR